MPNPPWPRRIAAPLACLALLSVLPLLVLQFRQDMQVVRGVALRPPGQQAGTAHRLIWLSRHEPWSLDDGELRAVAHALLANSPLHASAYRALAEDAQRHGQAERSLALLQAAIRHDPRDLQARARLLDHAADAGDWRSVVQHADVLARLGLVKADALVGVMARAAHDESGRRELLDRLGRHAPPWRWSLLAHLTAQDAPLALTDSVFVPLQGAAHALTSAELERWMSRLLQEGLAARAFALWIRGLDGRELAVSANLHDGGFELEPSGYGFGWRFGRVPGASIMRSAATGAVGSAALRVEFHAQRVAFAHVRQRLALWPGKYRLEGQVKPDGLQNERGLQWVLRCESGAALGESERFSGRGAWQPFALVFDVPAVGCSSQWLQLLLPARAPAERWVVGRIWFDAMRIERRATGDDPA